MVSAKPKSKILPKYHGESQNVAKNHAAEYSEYVSVLGKPGLIFWKKVSVERKGNFKVKQSKEQCQAIYIAAIVNSAVAFVS